MISNTLEHGWEPVNKRSRRLALRLRPREFVRFD